MLGQLFGPNWRERFQGLIERGKVTVDCMRDNSKANLKESDLEEGHKEKMASWLRATKNHWLWSFLLMFFSFANKNSSSASSSLSSTAVISTSKQINIQQAPSQLTKSNLPVQVLGGSLILKVGEYIPYCLQFQLRNRKKLVLDLDETLISSSHKHAPKHDISVNVRIGGTPATFFVRKRPDVDTFLEIVSQWFEVIVFTASMSSYANAVIDSLDPKRRIKRRFFRQSCTHRAGSYIKDLQVVCKDLSKVVIIDNSPVAYSFNKENAIPIDDWIGTNYRDESLLRLIPLLEELSHAEDVREVLKVYPKDSCTMNSTKPAGLSRKSNQ